MSTTTIQLTIPTSEVTFFKKLVSRMGWICTIITPSKKNGIEKGLEDIRKGNVFRAKDSADLVKQIFG